jgi:4-oxalocrotonate tautomerase
MPLVRIDVLQGYSEAQHELIGDSVQRAMMETLDVPERDRFQILSVHGSSGFDFNRSYRTVALT